MKKFIKNPDITMYAGIKVEKDTTLDFKNDHVEQHVKNLILRTVSTVKGDGYESVNDTTIYLKEGDVLIFEENGRGYVKPVEKFVTVAEAVEDLKCMEDL